ncbi:MAG: HdaA/DnaA family protein [Panacagrimonas sp.]
MKGAQLALPVQLPQTPCFENFFAGPNADMVDGLRRILAQASVPAIWLYGAESSGKSHLLRAAVLEAGQGALYLPLLDAGARERAPSAADASLLALDDVDAMAAERGGALVLLRLIDQRRLRRQPILLAAAAAPARIEVAIPDLRTRFTAMAVLGLKPLNDPDRRELLLLHAQARGLDLGDDSVAWLLTHVRRDAGSLIAALEQLDAASLSAKRRPTLPFVQQVLAPFLPRAPGNERTSSG